MSATLAPVPAQYYPNTNNTGAPAAGFKLFTYVAGTTTKQNTWTDSTQASINANPLPLDANGFAAASASASVWIDPTLVYKFVYAPANDTDPPSSPIRTIDNIAGPINIAVLTQTLLGPIIYPRTTAEIAASVTPTNYIYFPGHLRRYGAAINGSTDDSAALASAVAQAAQGGAPIYLPGSTGGCKILTGVTVSAPVLIYGDNYSESFFSTTADITILSFDVNGSRSIIKDVQVVGPGGSSTKPGVLFTNSNNTQIFRCRVRNFSVGVRYAPGINSCYVCSIHDSIIENNASINIDAQSNTNELSLYNVQFGGSSATGLKVVDSNSLVVYGGNCEGVSLCAIELDATAALAVAHLITGVHFESNNSSAGDIRIGNTATLRGVAIHGNFFKPGTADSGVNAVRCDGLSIIGNDLQSGYVGVTFFREGTVTNLVMLGNGLESDIPNRQFSNYNSLFADALTYDAPTVYDSAFANGTRYNLFKVKSGSLTASKNYYAGLDVVRVTNAGAAGAGAKAYARGAIASNGVGGSTKIGAFYAQGDVDISGGRFAPPKDDLTVQTGAVFQGSGAPSNSNGSNGDVYFRTDTPGTANQRMYIKSAGSWIGIV